MRVSEVPTERSPERGLEPSLRDTSWIWCNILLGDFRHVDGPPESRARLILFEGSPLLVMRQSAPALELCFVNCARVPAEVDWPGKDLRTEVTWILPRWEEGLVIWPEVGALAKGTGGRARGGVERGAAAFEGRGVPREVQRVVHASNRKSGQRIYVWWGGRMRHEQRSKRRGTLRRLPRWSQLALRKCSGLEKKV